MRPGSHGVVFPAVRAQAVDDASDEKLGRDEASKDGAVAAIANYLGVGRPDVQQQSTRHAGGMASTRGGDLKRAKTIARYIQTLPMVVSTAGVESEGGSEEHASNAGCRRRRTHTCGEL